MLQLPSLANLFGIFISIEFHQICFASILVSDHSYHANAVQMPSFMLEPPSHVFFSNTTGVHVTCSAHGNPLPLLTWLTKDGSAVNSVPGLRQVHSNGSLFFPSFASHLFRTDIHDQIYRCQASNHAGTIISRNIHVRAIIHQSYDVKVEGHDVFLNNVAFLKCTVSSHIREFVEITSWYRGDELLTDNSDISGRYIVTSGNVDLCMRTVRPDDATKKFSCLATNTLTGERKLSEVVTLSIKEAPQNMAPQSSQKSIMEMSVDRGSKIHLPCNIQGAPLPVYTWYRLSDSGSLYSVPSSQRIIPSQTLLLIRNVEERDAGRWICKASNPYGEMKLEIILKVHSYLTVHMTPQHQTVNSGSTGVFNCSVTSSSADMQIDWFHNGKSVIMGSDDLPSAGKYSLIASNSLRINDVGRDDRGIYQCLVSSPRSSIQASGELKLGDTMPEMIYRFIEQNVRPGPHISLKCSARGTPPPQFTWSLDSQPILDATMQHRYAIGQFVDLSGDVISHLNISHVRTEDGGLYKCRAANNIGEVWHMARLNVFGPPYVRAISPIRAVAGEDLAVFCPFSGHPIDSIRWERAGIEITSNNRYSISTIQQGGYLKINQIDPIHDAGSYTCIIRTRSSEEARRDIQINVNSPPVIESFAFPKNVQEGGRAQVTCAVSSGDMPIYFTWHKDGAPLSLSLQVLEKKEEFFSLLVFKDITARHSGKYTCYAANSAAKVNYTAELFVKVPPQWTSEPQDTHVMLGNPISVNCEASGYPKPKTTWFKGKNKASKEFQAINTRGSHTFSVNFATTDDEGFYMCEANNEIGNGLKKIIYVNVNEPARFDYASKNISARRNDPVVLTCHAMGDEPLNIAWTHNGNRIDLNNYRISIAEMKTDEGVRSQLSISRTDRHDSGKYRCVGENQFGRSEHLIFLAVQESPDAPSSLEVLEVKSRTVKLSWKRPYDGNSPVLSYLVQYKSLKSLHEQTAIAAQDEEWKGPHIFNLTLPSVGVATSYDGVQREQATIGNLHPSTTYLMRMLVVNEIARSPYTDAIVIKTQEEAPIEAPSSIQVQAGSVGELIVTWQVPQKLSWNGELLGYHVNYTEEIKQQLQNAINYSNRTVSKTITVHGWATTKSIISGLRKFTKYSIRIRAFNSIAPGPWSTTIFATTLEGIPESPPQNVNCTALSSQSIKISWTEPPPQFHGGIIQGYKVLYRPMIKQQFMASEVKRTTNMETYLHGLMKATNYSVRVLAFTTSGDGMHSMPIYCTTDEDVPDAPANCKAAALTGESILISWLSPTQKNGIITHYTVYSKESGRKVQTRSNMVRVDENGLPRTFEARNLVENQKYDFWVTASTAVGEGEPTSLISQLTNTRAPARIASFSQTIKVPVGTSLLLECYAVGNPTPRALWLTRDRAVTHSSFYQVTAEGHLKIHSVETSLSGNYTCSAKNLFGEDEIYYHVVALKPPSAPQLSVQFTTADSIKLKWEVGESGGIAILGFIILYRVTGETWSRIELSPDQTSFVLNSLKCGTQYILKMSAHNKVGDGQASEEINVWTKGKTPQAPDEKDFLKVNMTCLNMLLSSWNNGGCSISHFSIEYRPLGDHRWTVVSSDTSTLDGNKDSLVFCDFKPASWYQLRISARNEAGKTSVQYNFATTTVDGEPIPLPEYFPIDVENALIEGNDWMLLAISIILSISFCMGFIILRYKGNVCQANPNHYESHTIPNDIKDAHDNRRNQQVYTASPVKIIDKDNDSEMYEISPYATFSVTGGRTVSQGHSKTPTRGAHTPSALDYTMQFKTFGHPEGELDLNATAYPILPSGGGGGFGHVKGKSSWHKQRYYNTDDDSTLSKSMTVVASSARLRNARDGSSQETRLIGRNPGTGSGGMRSKNHHSKGGSESDTSLSPTNEFSNAPTYRIPIKHPRELFRPDSSTESNDISPIRERRSNTPRHLNHEPKRTRTRDPMDIMQSNNSSDSEVNLDEAIKFRPPNGFTDSREFSETECDRDRALDLEVQQALANKANGKASAEEITSLLARYHEKKEQERNEYTIHV